MFRINEPNLVGQLILRFERQFSLGDLMVSSELQIALAHHSAGRLSETVAVCQQILASDPNNAVALHLLGVATLQRGQNERAVELMRRSVALEPRSAAWHNNLSLALHSLGRIPEAEDACRMSLLIEPNSATRHNNIGTILAAQERILEAIESFERAIAIAPMPEAHYNLGRALDHQGRYVEALEQFRRAIGISPHYAEAHFAEAHNVLVLGDLPTGFKKLEWRWRLPGKTAQFPTHPLWQGEPLGQKNLAATR